MHVIVIVIISYFFSNLATYVSPISLHLSTSTFYVLPSLSTYKYSTLFALMLFSMTSTSSVSTVHKNQFNILNTTSGSEILTSL